VVWVLQLPHTPIKQPALATQASVTPTSPPTSSGQPAQASVTPSPPPTSSGQPAQASVATQLPPYIFQRLIRCETRQAIIDTAIGWLTDEQNMIEGKVDRASRAIGIGFQNGRPIQQFSPKLFKGIIHDIVAAFYDSGVAYTFALFIKGGLDRKRENESLFTVTDSFSGLIQLPEDYCNDTV
jgi:hypothetical protein